jgi:hypothetical protein
VFRLAWSIRAWAVGRLDSSLIDFHVCKISGRGWLVCSYWKLLVSGGREGKRGRTNGYFLGGLSRRRGVFEK